MLVLHMCFTHAALPATCACSWCSADTSAASRPSLPAVNPASRTFSFSAATLRWACGSRSPLPATRRHKPRCRRGSRVPYQTCIQMPYSTARSSMCAAEHWLGTLLLQRNGTCLQQQQRAFRSPSHLDLPASPLCAPQTLFVGSLLAVMFLYMEVILVRRRREKQAKGLGVHALCSVRALRCLCDSPPSAAHCAPALLNAPSACQLASRQGVSLKHLLLLIPCLLRPFACSLACLMRRSRCRPAPGPAEASIRTVRF